MRVFENRVLRRMFVAWRDELRGWWRILHSEGLIDLCSTPPPLIIRANKSSIMRWAENVEEMGKEEVHTEFWCGSLREELEEIGVYGSIKLIWIFRKWDAGHGWIDLVKNRAR